jgi:integrase
MATVYRKTYTMIMPKNIEIVERDGKKMAKWVDCNGKKHLDPTTVGRRGQLKIVRFAPTFLAQYRDADGQMVIESTGCRDEQSARHVLAERVKRVEHIKAGILTGQQCRTADHARSALQNHITDYLGHLRAKTIRGKRVSQSHRSSVLQRLNTLVNDCHFKRLGDITRDAMEKWMNRAEQQGMGPRTRNTYRAAIIAFCNWCVETDRLAANPLSRLCSADEHADRRKTRRALTEEELRRLFIAARLRPLAEYGRVTVKVPKPSGRKTWKKQPLCFETLESAVQTARVRLRRKPRLIATLEWQGKERALVYKVLTLTGLRRGELASMTMGQLWLDEKQPYLELKAKDEKNGRGAQIPLRSDLVADIRLYLSEKQRYLHLTTLPAAMSLFDMPRSMTSIFDRDLAAAGIDKRDERGRTLDVHALRHTFGTHLSKAGVPPRVAQAAMRHSTLNLTMNIYTDPSLLDVVGAVNALPRFTDAAPAKTGT